MRTNVQNKALSFFLSSSQRDRKLKKEKKDKFSNKFYPSILHLITAPSPTTTDQKLFLLRQWQYIKPAWCLTSNQLWIICRHLPNTWGASPCQTRVQAGGWRVSIGGLRNFRQRATGTYRSWRLSMIDRAKTPSIREEGGGEGGRGEEEGRDAFCRARYIYIYQRQYLATRSAPAWTWLIDRQQSIWQP